MTNLLVWAIYFQSLFYFSEMAILLLIRNAEFPGFEPKVTAALLSLQGRMEKVCTISS